MKAKALIGKGLKFLSKHDQTILTGVSIASGVMGVIFAWNARPKCEQVLNELNERGASKGEKAKALAKILGPVIIAEGVMVTTAVVGHKKFGEKVAAGLNAAGTYKTMDDIRKEIENEQLTEDKVKQIDDRVVEERIKRATAEEIEETGHGDTLFIEPKYTGKIWKANRDFVELGVAKCDKKLYACYDQYGTCKNDEFAISLWDLCKEWGLSTADIYEMYEYKGRDYRSLPIKLEPFEFVMPDGTSKLGYKVDFYRNPSLAYSDLIDAN